MSVAFVQGEGVTRTRWSADGTRSPGGTVEIPQLQREALFRAETLDDKARTVEIVWSTGARVRRWSWVEWDEVDEELSLDPAHCDLSRLNKGAPLLDCHRSYSNLAVIGVHERAWLGDGAGCALVRFDDEEYADKLYRKVKNRIVRGVSTGYQVGEYVVTRKDGHRPLYTAVRWTPIESSIVPIGADPDAHVRQDEGGRVYSLPKNPCQVSYRGALAAASERAMSDTQKNQGTTAPSALTEAERSFLSHAYSLLRADAPEKARSALDELSRKAGEVDALRLEVIGLRRAEVEADAKREIEEAKRAGKVTPAEEGELLRKVVGEKPEAGKEAEALARSQGELTWLRGFLKAKAKVLVTEQDDKKPTEQRRGVSGAEEVLVTLSDGRKYEELGNVERGHVRQADPALFEALRGNWIARGRPAAAKK